MRVAAVSVNQTPMDWDGNLQRIVEGVRAAKKQGADLVCFPELCLSGYGCEDQFLYPEVRENSQDLLRELLPETAGITVVVGLALEVEGRLYNASAVASDQTLLGYTCKHHLARHGLHYEPRWFDAWEPGAVKSLDGVPCGDLIFQVGKLRFAIEICEDAWVEPRRAENFGSHVDLVLCPSASHFAMGKHESRRRLGQEAAKKWNNYYLYCNLLGCEAGPVIYDGDAMIFSPTSTMARVDRFSFKDHQIAYADIVPAVHSKAPNLPVIQVKPTNSGQKVALRLSGADDEWIWQQEFTKAVSLGLFDYMRKSHSRGFVVSLSGGADSSAVAALVRCMIDDSVAELSFSECLKRLRITQKSIHDPMALCGLLLHCVYQSTKNSSASTLRSAQELADGLGASFDQIKLEPLVDQYRHHIEEILGRPLTWESDDLSLQNVQARTRAPSVWLLANVKNFLLLTTSNRSELAVGYATMDGDTCGGLAPIAGLDKAKLLEWLKWLEKDRIWGASLRTVNGLQPTAELRPAEYGQTDEEDLMPYPILSQIERLAFVERHGPEKVLKNLELTHPNVSEIDRRNWVLRFFTLWTRNQWKRQRMAVGFHLDDMNFDPTSWCRFPILSRAWSRELAILRQESQDIGDSRETSASCHHEI